MQGGISSHAPSSVSKVELMEEYLQQGAGCDPALSYKQQPCQNGSVPENRQKCCHSGGLSVPAEPALQLPGETETNPRGLRPQQQHRLHPHMLLGHTHSHRSGPAELTPTHRRGLLSTNPAQSHWSPRGAARCQQKKEHGRGSSPKIRASLPNIPNCSALPSTLTHTRTDTDRSDERDLLV